MATLKAEDILKRTLNLLQARQFDEAMGFFIHQAKAQGMTAYGERVEALRESYTTLLTKFNEAKFDTQQTEDEYNDLMLQFYDELQGMCLSMAVPFTQSVSTVKDGINRLMKDKGDKELCDLFTTIYQSEAFDSETRSHLHQFIMNEDVPVYMRCCILSAVMLHLFLHFDTEMLENIYAYTLDDQPEQIRWQAWVTMFLCAVVHPTRIEHCDKIREQYQFMAESEPELFLSMQLTLLQCKETSNIHDRVVKLLSKKGDEEQRTQKIFQFVAEGADLSYSAFKMMRHMPFFAGPDNSAHWLMPFSTEQELIKGLLNRNPQFKTMVDLLSKSLAQSDQDKYGSVLMLAGTDAKIVEQMGGQLQEAGLELDKVVSPSGEVLMRNYMHDIYRYFTLSFTGIHATVSPFRENLDLGRLSWLAPALGSTKALRAIGEYLVYVERWDEATLIYSRLVNKENSEFALQRLGFTAAQRQTRNFQLEGDPLIRCNKMFPGNVWTLLHLAKFYRRTGILTASTIHLGEALQKEPDNVELLNELAECYMEMNVPDKALETYFKLDLQNEGDVKIQRQIVLSAFLAHNMETARKYMRLVLSHRKPINADWAMAGTIALKDENIEDMLECFGHIGSLRSRLAGFDGNIRHMTAAGVPEYLITIARDALNKI